MRWGAWGGMVAVGRWWLAYVIARDLHRRMGGSRTAYWLLARFYTSPHEIFENR